MHSAGPNFVRCLPGVAIPKRQKGLPNHAWFCTGVKPGACDDVALMLRRCWGNQVALPLAFSPVLLYGAQRRSKPFWRSSYDACMSFMGSSEADCQKHSSLLLFAMLLKRNLCKDSDQETLFSKASLSNETWDLIQQKNRVRNESGPATRFLRKQELHCGFDLWAKQHQPQEHALGLKIGFDLLSSSTNGRPGAYLWASRRQV